MHRSADVGQLDDVGLGQQRQTAQLGEVVRDLLLVGQEVGELAQDTACDRDVAGFDIDTCGRREGAHDGQERAGGQTRRFIGQGVDDGGLLGAHLLSQVVNREVKPPYRRRTMGLCARCENR
ncbi:hypothetical protein D3C71_1656670 [compost metagenome]